MGKIILKWVLILLIGFIVWVAVGLIGTHYWTENFLTLYILVSGISLMFYIISKLIKYHGDSPDV